MGGGFASFHTFHQTTRHWSGYSLFMINHGTSLKETYSDIQLHIIIQLE